MAEMSQQNGVTHIVCTPHSSEHFKFDPELNLERLQMQLRDTARELAPTQPGAASSLRDALNGMDQNDLTNLVQRTTIQANGFVQDHVTDHFFFQIMQVFFYQRLIFFGREGASHPRLNAEE